MNGSLSSTVLFPEHELNHYRPEAASPLITETAPVLQVPGQIPQDPQVTAVSEQVSQKRTLSAVRRVHQENAAVSAFTWGGVAAVGGSLLFTVPLWAGFIVGFFAVASVLSLASAAEPQ